MRAADKYKHPMSTPNYLLQVRADAYHRHSGSGQAGNGLIDRGARSHVDAAGWFLQNEDLWRTVEPARDNHLLLIAAVQLTRCLSSLSFHPEVREPVRRKAR